MRPMRVLVCGSNYGRAYITALRHEPRKYELAGILARGGGRSQRVAAVNGVPLYRSADEVPDNIGLACAAMSSAAWPLVLQLVRRGIHVLCEHPYPPGVLKKALLLASKHNVQFHVNGHFANLPAPRAFIHDCRRLGKLARPKFVEVMATERSLYGALDILASALGRLPPLRVRVLSRRAKFVLLEGTLETLPVRVSVQVSDKKGSGQLADGSPAYLLDLRLTIAFPTGVLTLLSVAGPVVWTSTPAQVLGNSEHLSAICHHEKLTLAELGEQRVRANVEALNSIRNAILGHGVPRTQQPEHILQVSKAWEHIGRQLYSA
jgi:yersiniabactin synthetase, thiazolinyl reductase component